LRRIYHAGLALTWLVVASVLLLKGLDYYLVPLAERPFAPGHGVFDPTGRVGNRLGIAGASMMAVGVVLYSTRKRWPLLSGAGRLRDWLSLHIFLCTLGPFLVVLHTSFRVSGLVAIAFWSMIVVVASGVIGRYVYVRIPRALNGNARTREELAAEQQALLARIREQAGEHVRHLETWLASEPVRQPGLLGALGGALMADLRARREQRQIARVLSRVPASGVLREQMQRNLQRHRRLSRERAFIEPFQQLFLYWHAFHLPLAVVMLLVLAVHVAVAIAFGYGWTP
jgi:hypothetical protein